MIMNRWTNRLLSAATLGVLVLTSCQTTDSPEPLYEAVDACVEDQHGDLTDLAPGSIGVKLSNVVTVDHPDAQDHLVITEAFCIQDELNAPAEAHIPHPTDITARFAAEWEDDGHRFVVAATHVGDDGLTLDIIFYQGTAR